MLNHLLSLGATKKFTSNWKLQSRINRRVVLAFLVMVCILSGLSIIVGSQWSSIVISSHGNLKVDGVGAYQDANCGIAMKYLDWGTVEPGSVKNITLHVRNEGNHVATLFLATNGWMPVNASTYMSLSWNYNGESLRPMESIGVTLTLSVAPDAKNIVDFSFNVIIGTNG